GFPVPRGFVVAVAPGSRDVQAAAITDAAQSAGPGPYAVRSSAAAEDLPGASYAGMYESYLDVEPDRLRGAIRRCAESATTARVSAYQSHRTPGDRDGDPGMAVLVQQMIAASAAGVAFSSKP